MRLRVFFSLFSSSLNFRHDDASSRSRRPSSSSTSSFSCTDLFSCILRDHYLCLSYSFLFQRLLLALRFHFHFVVVVVVVVVVARFSTLRLTPPLGLRTPTWLRNFEQYMFLRLRLLFPLLLLSMRISPRNTRSCSFSVFRDF